MAFAHLHLHTEFSLLDGACRIKKLVQKLKDLGQDACAVTDHGVLYGAIDFYSALKQANLHPVIGCEVYVANDRLSKDSLSRDYSHLILLCENMKGYQNLTYLVSEGFVSGYYYKPRIDYKLLEAHSEGLIALSACISGDLPKLLLNEQTEEARAYVRNMQRIMGKNNFFIEMMDHGILEEKTVLPRLIRLAKEMDVPLVATNDCHYINKEDADAQEVLMCIQTGKTLEDETRMRMETRELYVKSEDEMKMLFKGNEDAVDRANEIAHRCQLDFDFNQIHLPKYPVPTQETSEEMLKRITMEGFLQRYQKDDQVALDRLTYEQNTIINMGYVDYFLIVWDFIKYAKDNGIMVGPGRGSGAGSIVAYCLNITGLDPLKYNLLFERFLNPERVTMPDIDIDFCYERRQEVIDYVARKYGSDHVSQIITFGTMAARGVLRDVGRVLSYPYQEVDVIAKSVPMAPDMTLEKALDQSPELKSMYEENDRVQKLINTALTLEGMPRHASTHAAGVLITKEPVTHYVPLQKNDEVITTQYPMGVIEKLGLLKMDFLGLRTLTVLKDTLDMLKKRDIIVRLEDIPLDDEKVFDMICMGDTDGVFQLEGDGMRTFLSNMKPRSFEEVIAAISLYRPGPMDSIPKYIKGKQHPDSVQYLTPLLAPILDVTYGCMVYQEQVMQIVRDLAGYSYGRSDLVRRAMAKKKKDVMAKERHNFIYGSKEDNIKGAVHNGVPEDVADKIFDEMTAFASYAFNKPHAACYAVLSLQTGYLKCHYPEEFMAALMNSVIGNATKISGYIYYCRQKNIPILPPHVNHSFRKFTVDTTSEVLGIRFGMSGVKNVGTNTVDAIVRDREINGIYTDIFDFIKRMGGEYVNKRAVESLIKAGCFDNLNATRTQLLSVYENAMDSETNNKKTQVRGQVSLFDMEDSTDSALQFENTYPPMEEFRKAELLKQEKEMTGVYISGHPLDEYQALLKNMTMTTSDILALEESEDMGVSEDQKPVLMGGIIVECHQKATRKGSMMGFLTLEDLTGQIEGILFPRVNEVYGRELASDKAVMIKGKLSVREDESPKLIVNTIEPLENASQPKIKSDALLAKESKTKLYIKLLREDIPKVSSILKNNSGATPVYFHLPNENLTLLAPKNLWVENADFARGDLMQILDAQNIKVVESK